MLVLGIDEVGRGAWAGPLVVGAVILESCHCQNCSKSAESSNEILSQVQHENLKGLKDSKKLTKKQRETLSKEIKSSALAVGIGWVDAATLDKIGLSAALKLATERAFAQIPPEIQSRLDQIIIDGTIKFLDDPRVITLAKADAKIAAVSAAAIAAKAFRDDYMTRLNHAFPTYDFDKHVGYGTALHRKKLQKFGPLDGIHRQSFAPVANLTNQNLERSRVGPAHHVSGNANPDVRNLTARQSRGRVSRTAGYVAEAAAAEFLQKKGHRIIARNWKTKFCEIDIISACDDTVFFTEVKYRENANFGDGLSAITQKKLKQMKLAAELFLTKHAETVQDHDVQISVIALAGAQPTVENYLANID